MNARGRGRGVAGGPVVALAVVVRDGRVLLARRPADRPLGGLWEFPGGKVEPGEAPAAAAVRELEEETGLRATRAEIFFDKAPFSPGVRRLVAFLVTVPEGEPRPLDSDEVAWLPAAALAGCRMPEANRPVIDALAARLAGRAERQDPAAGA